ncbi:hypothetical protein Tco_0026187 [Tanacetum coccineum]
MIPLLHKKISCSQRSEANQTKCFLQESAKKQRMTYLKYVGGSDCSAEQKEFEKIQYDMNEKAAGMDKEEVSEEPESTKVKVKIEEPKENIRKRSGRRLKMKAPKRYPIINWESKFYDYGHFGRELIYYKVFRADGSSRWIKTFSKMIKLFDMLDLIEIRSLVMKIFETTPPEGIDLLLWGDLRTMFESKEDDKLWKNQEEWKL